MIQETSLEAWAIIQPKLGSMQNMIYNFIKMYPGCSNHDISDGIERSINCVTPRVKELREKGLVMFSHYKQDYISNKRVMCWCVP